MIRLRAGRGGHRNLFSYAFKVKARVVLLGVEVWRFGGFSCLLCPFHTASAKSKGMTAKMYGELLAVVGMVMHTHGLVRGLVRGFFGWGRTG